MVNLDIGFGIVNVWIESNGERLPEFQLRAPDGPYAQNCYVASKEDAVRIPIDVIRAVVILLIHVVGDADQQPFSVHWQTVTRPLINEQITVFVDGVGVRSVIIHEGTHQTSQADSILVTNTEERT